MTTRRAHPNGTPNPRGWTPKTRPAGTGEGRKGEGKLCRDVLFVAAGTLRL